MSELREDFLILRSSVPSSSPLLSSTGMWLDGIVVPSSLALEIHAPGKVSLLMVLRLWRLLRIFSGFWVHLDQFERVSELVEELEEELDYALDLLRR